MSNRSRLVSREEYSHYKANKHLERAASLLNQQSFGVRDMQEAHEFGAIKRQIDKERKLQVITLESEMKNLKAHNATLIQHNKDLSEELKELKDKQVHNEDWWRSQIREVRIAKDTLQHKHDQLQKDIKLLKEKEIAHKEGDRLVVIRERHKNDGKAGKTSLHGTRDEEVLSVYKHSWEPESKRIDGFDVTEDGFKKLDTLLHKVVPNYHKNHPGGTVEKLQSHFNREGVQLNINIDKPSKSFDAKSSRRDMTPEELYAHTATLKSMEKQSSIGAE